MELNINWIPEKRKLADLKEYEKNPRKITPQALEYARESVIQRGFHNVFKVDTNNVILSGNQAKKVLLDLGIDEIYVMVPNRPLTEEERKLVVLESNRHWGDWDFDSLSQNFTKHELELSGFQKHELTFMNPSDNSGNSGEPEEEDTGKPKVKPFIIFIPDEIHQDIVNRFDLIKEKIGVENNTTTFIRMLEFFENNI